MLSLIPSLTKCLVPDFKLHSISCWLVLYSYCSRTSMCSSSTALFFGNEASLNLV